MNSCRDSAERFERAVLGAVLLNEAMWPQIATLRPADFSLDSHRRIYARTYVVPVLPPLKGGNREPLEYHGA